jgi:hypothetical protein
MRQYNLNALESLESKFSLSSMSFAGIIAAPAPPMLVAQEWSDDDYGGFCHGDGAVANDPLPNPEPPPGPDPGDNPPVVYPILPPSGPSGPGS